MTVNFKVVRHAEDMAQADDPVVLVVIGESAGHRVTMGRLMDLYPVGPQDAWHSIVPIMESDAMLRYPNGTRIVTADDVAFMWEVHSRTEQVYMDTAEAMYMSLVDKRNPLRMELRCAKVGCDGHHIQVAELPEHTCDEGGCCECSGDHCCHDCPTFIHDESVCALNGCGALQ